MIGVVSVIGAGSVNPTTNVGRLVMTLKPRGERRDDVGVGRGAAEGARRRRSPA